VNDTVGLSGHGMGLGLGLGEDGAVKVMEKKLEDIEHGRWPWKDWRCCEDLEKIVKDLIVLPSTRATITSHL